MDTKEKRTECVFFYCTPTVKKQINEYADDDVMKEKIIKDYIESEKSFMKESLNDLSENEIKYKYSLIKIKDDFKNAQEAYVKELESLYDVANESQSKLKEKLEAPKEAILKMIKEVNDFKELLSKIPSYYINNISELLDIVERFNKMDKNSKDILAKLMEK